MKEGLPFFLTSGRHTVKNGLPLQFFNQAGKIADVAADAVQTVDHDGTDLPRLGSGHHLFEVRAVQVAAGKALVLKDDRLLCCGIAVVGADIFAAEVDLISDTFALAGIAGLAGIDGNGVGGNHNNNGGGGGDGSGCGCLIAIAVVVVLILIVLGG